MTSATRPRAYVVGWPVKHSRSPIIHNYWIKMHGLDGAYERLGIVYLNYYNEELEFLHKHAERKIIRLV